MELVYKFKPEEVMQDFKLIGETFSRNIVHTGRSKRLYAVSIDAKGHDDIAQELINKARYAYTHGLKNDVELTIEQILVLKELVVYCMEL